MQDAHSIDGEAAAADAEQFVTFSIGDDHYGVAIMAVQEINNWTGARHLPSQPDYVRGVVSVRGVYIPIVDLRCRFGLGLTEPTPHHVFIVVQIGARQVDARQVGLLADGVSDIVSASRADIKPVPDVSETTAGGFLSGLLNIDDAVVGLIDLDSILATEAEAEAA